MARQKSASSSDTYYLVIRGKKYDRRMVELADGLTQGRGDGRISINDAKNLLRVVKDANNYSDIEKQTMEYIRKNYKFTKEGDEFFRTEIRKWAASKHGKKKPAAAKDKPVAAAAVTRVITEPSPAASAPASQPAKKASAWKGMVVVLVLLILLAALFYFVVYHSSCAPHKKETAVRSAEAPTTATLPATPTPAVAETATSAATAQLREFVAAQKIAFRSGKTELNAASARILDALADRLKREPVRMLIKGHSCVLGSKELNQKISEQRAQIVKEALIRRGVKADRIEARGVADSEPAGDNRTAAGRVASRRVTFSIIP